MSNHSSNGSATSQIVHFDATLVRKEKMRKVAEAEHASSAAPATAVKSPPVKAPVAPAPVPQPKPAPAPVAQQAAALASTATATSGGVTVRMKKAIPGDNLETFLINFVVEQTGYPAEIVEMDADLEADLGIDSIKKAQLFGELREYFEFDMTSAANMSLDDFPTLRHVMKFLAGGVSAPAVEAKPEPAPAPKPVVADSPRVVAPPAPEPTAESVSGVAVRRKPNAPPIEQMESFLVNFVVEQTGYPAEIVELDADLEADLGIDSIKKAQLFGELREYFEFDMSGAANMSLEDFPTLRHVLNFLNGAQTGAAAKAEPAKVSAPAPEAKTNRTDRTDTTDRSDSPPAVAPAPASGVAVRRKPNAPPLEQMEPFLVNFVVEQTGYPAEIVELDADLEADLGIDSIKKAQLFGELREYFEFDMSGAANMSLEDFPTLRHVLNFLNGSAATPAPKSEVIAVQHVTAAVVAPAPRIAHAHHASANGNGNGAVLSNGAKKEKNYPRDASMLDSLRRILIENGIAEAARANITSNTRLMDDVGLDSVGMLDLINAVEKEFEISISLDDLELEGLNSASAFASLIQKKLAGVA